MKTYKMEVLIKLNHTDFPPLLSSTVSKPVSSVPFSLSCITASRSFSNKVSALSFKYLTKDCNKSFPRATRFYPGNFAPKHLHNPSQSLVFDLARNVPTKLKHYVICKSVVPFEPVAVNGNFASVSVCKRVNAVRSVFCHPHVSILAIPLFNAVKFVRPVTVYNIKSVNSAHHISRVVPSVNCTTSSHWNFSNRRHENVTSFLLPSSNLLFPPGIKSHLSTLTLRLNLSQRYLSPATSSPPNFPNIFLFLMTLFNVILLNQLTQYILFLIF